MIENEFDTDGAVRSLMDFEDDEWPLAFGYAFSGTGYSLPDIIAMMEAA